MKTGTLFNKDNLKTLAMIFTGCAIYAVAFNLFFQPNSIAMGGFTGLAQILHRLIPALPVGIATILMNIPLFIIGVKKQGLRLLIGSLTAMTTGSLMIDALALVVTFQPMDPLLACIYGGALVGLSCGIMMTVGATTGGSDLAARLLRYKLRHISIGKLCLIIDAIVITLYAITFHSINNSLYGIVAMYVASLAMDMVIYGSNTAKLSYIISNHSQEITQRLLDAELGVTLLNGKGAFTGDEKKVILCAVKNIQINVIKTIVTTIDPAAFIIVCDAHEVLGEGFGEFSADSL